MATDPEQGPTSAEQGPCLDHSICLRDGLVSGAVVRPASTITKAITKACATALEVRPIPIATPTLAHTGHARTSLSHVVYVG